MFLLLLLFFLLLTAFPALLDCQPKRLLSDEPIQALHTQITAVSQFVTA